MLYGQTRIGKLLKGVKYTGADCVEVDENTKTLTISGGLTQLFVDGFLYAETVHYTFSSGVITFLVPIFESQIIMVYN